MPSYIKTKYIHHNNGRKTKNILETSLSIQNIHKCFSSIANQDFCTTHKTLFMSIKYKCILYFFNTSTHLEQVLTYRYTPTVPPTHHPTLASTQTHMIEQSRRNYRVVNIRCETSHLGCWTHIYFTITVMANSRYNHL